MRKQMFINVQPYINQTINMSKYQNPFSFGQGGQANNTGFALPKPNTFNIQ